ncbi:MAG: AraC family transcriptional regulator [Sedimentibacter sp.]|uniref:AraC family transcriptional regulator n=1 Tax=Sedimentibacter sp. TaxID=1960295 RepID=UPI0031588B7D
MILEERTVCYDRDLEIEAYRFKGIMQKFPNHFHEHYVIGYIESGRRFLSCKNKTYSIEAGDLVLFNPMDNHTCEQLDDMALDYRCINVKTDIMKKAAFEVTGNEYLPCFTQPVVQKSELTGLLCDLHKSIMEEQPGFKKEETFLFLIEQIIEEYTKPFVQHANSEVREEIQSVCRYIDDHYPERITLDDLSCLSKMNKYSLLRSFTRHMGITPYRYLETVRINKAKELLESGVEPVDTAMQTGFADQSHFTNFFKEFIGLTPKQYQNIFNRDE